MTVSVSPRQFVLGVAAVLLLVGFLGLVVPASVEGTFGNKVSCGSALAPGDDAGIADSSAAVAGAMYGRSVVGTAEASCASALGARQAWAWPVAIIGLIGVAGAAVVRFSPPAPAGAETRPAS